MATAKIRSGDDTKPEQHRSSGNVFKDLGFAHDQAENMKIRAKLMLSLRRYINENGLTQNEAADLLGVTQPEISNLVNGKIQKFSIDKLVNMHAKAQLRVSVEAEQA